MRSAFYKVDRGAWLLLPESRRLSKERASPEEAVRQWCLHELLRAYGVCVTNLEIERPVRVGTRRHRADIVVLRDGQPFIVIECKSRRTRKHDDAMLQAISYATAADMNAEFAAYTNGDIWWVRRRIRDQWVPVSDLPVFRNGTPTADWRDILLAVDRTGPVLYWMDEPVPAKHAPRYFGALQRFFHATNEITEDTDHRLRWAADHVLRVLDDVNRHPNYTGARCPTRATGSTSTGRAGAWSRPSLEETYGRWHTTPGRIYPTFLRAAGMFRLWMGRPCA